MEVEFCGCAKYTKVCQVYQELNNVKLNSENFCPQYIKMYVHVHVSTSLTVVNVSAIRKKWVFAIQGVLKYGVN